MMRGTLSAAVAILAALTHVAAASEDLSGSQDNSLSTAQAEQAPPSVPVESLSPEDPRQQDRDRFVQQCRAWADSAGNSEELNELCGKIEIKSQGLSLVIKFPAHTAMPPALVSQILDAVWPIPPQVNLLETYSSYVLRDLSLEEDLRLAGGTVDLPVVFENLKAGTPGKPISIIFDAVDFFRGFIVDNSTIHGAIVITRANINGNLVMADSHIHGQFILSDSAVFGRLRFSSNAFYEPAVTETIEPDDATQPSLFRVSHTTIEQSTSLTHNVFISDSIRSAYFIDSNLKDALDISHNDMAHMMFIGRSTIPRVVIQSNRFRSGLVVDNNTVDTIHLSQNYTSGWYQANNNRLTGRLDVKGEWFDETILAIELTENAVGSSFSFRPRMIFPEKLNTINLGHNSVGGHLDLILPVASGAVEAGTGQIGAGTGRRGKAWLGWGGAVNLAGSTVAGRLRLAHSTFPPRQYVQLRELEGTARVRRIASLPQDLRSSTVAATDNPGLQRPSGGDVRSSFIHDSDNYCPENNAFLYINMSAADVDILDWNMPLDDCKRRWYGAGLNFEYWGDPGSISYPQNPNGTHNGKSRDLLTSDVEEMWRKLAMLWRFSVAEPENSSTVADLAYYLQGRGFYSDGLFLLAEAKQKDYDPSDDCRRYGLLSRGCLNASALYGSLYPTKWGTRPERALYWLIGLLIVSCLVSLVYWKLRTANSAHPVGPSKPSAGADRAGSRGATEGQETVAPWGLQDSPRGFGREGAPETAAPGGRVREPGVPAGRSEPASPAWMTGLLYGADVALPAVSLGYYGKVEPPDGAVKVVAVILHILAWYLGTLFLASITIL